MSWAERQKVDFSVSTYLRNALPKIRLRPNRKFDLRQETTVEKETVNEIKSVSSFNLRSIRSDLLGSSVALAGIACSKALQADQSAVIELKRLVPDY